MSLFKMLILFYLYFLSLTSVQSVSLKLADIALTRSLAETYCQLANEQGSTLTQAIELCDQREVCWGQ